MLEWDADGTDGGDQGAAGDEGQHCRVSLVASEERTAAASVTLLARSAGSATSPIVSGSCCTGGRHRTAQRCNDGCSGYGVRGCAGETMVTMHVRWLCAGRATGLMP